MILDAGILVSVDRGEEAVRALLTAIGRASRPLRTTHPVVAQVWRDGARQARLSAFLKTVEIHPFNDGPAVGGLLAASDVSDVVDAHLVLLAAKLGEAVVTGDPDDLTRIASSLGSRQPVIHPWP